MLDSVQHQHAGLHAVACVQLPLLLQASSPQL
jgi:hypothetical protein